MEEYVVVGLEWGLRRESLWAAQEVSQQHAADPAGVNPLRRYMQSCNPQNRTAEPMSLPDRIERIGRALTAAELASMLTGSRITIFKQAKAGRIPPFRTGHWARFDRKQAAEWLRETLRYRRLFSR